MNYAVTRMKQTTRNRSVNFFRQIAEMSNIFHPVCCKKCSIFVPKIIMLQIFWKKFCLLIATFPSYIKVKKISGSSLVTFLIRFNFKQLHRFQWKNCAERDDFRSTLHLNRPNTTSFWRYFWPTLVNLWQAGRYGIAFGTQGVQLIASLTPSPIGIY